MKTSPPLLRLMGFVYLIFLASCKQTQTGTVFLPGVLKDSVWSSYNESLMQMCFRLRLRRKTPEIVEYLGPFYIERSFRPNLLIRFLKGQSLDSLLFFVRNVSEHGLTRRSSDEAGLVDLLDKVKTYHYKTTLSAYLDFSLLELRLTSLYLRYGHDLAFGAVDPSLIYKSRFNIKLRKPSKQFYDSLLLTSNLTTTLKALQPVSDAYLTMKDSLARLSLKGEKQLALGPNSFKISKLKINMERLRWKSELPLTTYVLVNIPSFRLYAYEKDSLAWSMAVCVGERKEVLYNDKYLKYLKSHNIDDRPANHQTPLLTSEFRSIQLNPKWNIPASILQNELYYKLRKNPNYLAENNMKLYKGNRQVGRLDTIRWENIARSKIGFQVKQDAGELNALGKIKFSFNNPYSIYLHDTPAKSRFKKSVRDVSHGCVRLENPLKLADWLLRANGRRSMDYVRILIGTPPVDSSQRLTARYEREQLQRKQGHVSSTSVVLKQKTPLYIGYFTCWPDSTGRLKFYDDVYNLDALLERSAILTHVGRTN